MPRTLLDWLTERFPASKKQTLKRMAAAGRVRVNGHPIRKLAHALDASDRVAVDEAADGTPTDAPSHDPRRAYRPPPQVRVVFEDDDILVVDKPAGLLTSTVPNEPRPTLLAMVREYVANQDARARLGLIHRLDRDASGILMFSKNDAAYHALKTQLFRHDVERIYTALVHGNPQPPAGRIESRLVERPDGSVHPTKQWGKGEQAVTEYEVVRREGALALLKVTLHTGRKHQIRVHLSGRGWPIVGDRMYGKDGEPKGELRLAATRLAITHPRTAERMTFEVPLGKRFVPKEFTT